MTTDEAITFFKNLRNQTTKKAELKIYDDFIHTLTKVNKKNLSTEDQTSIELTLDNLNLRTAINNKRKYYKKAANDLKVYLKQEFSFVSKGYYTSIGMSLGMCFGVAFGTLISKSTGTSIGLAFGMLIGLCIGRFMDTKTEKEGKVL